MARKKIRDKHYPIPESLPERGGQAWDIEHDTAHPRTDNKEKIMYIPLNDNEREARIRAHEMAHARWSPDAVPKRKDIEPMTFQAVEDSRMWVKLRDQAGIDLSGAVSEQDLVPWVKQVEEGNVPAKTVAQMLTAASFTGDENGLKDEVRRIIRETSPETMAGRLRKSHLKEALRIADRIKRRMGESTREFEDTVRLSSELQDLCDALEMKEDEEEPAESKSEIEEAIEDGDEEGEGDGEGDGETLTEMMDKYDSFPDDGTKVDWGEMVIEPENLPRRMPGSWMGYTRRAADYGTVPRRIHRWGIDKQIFDRVSRKPTRPSVLIDGSGSMSLSSKEIWEICETFPFATVAIYGGVGDHGFMKILVNKNRVASDDNMGCEWGLNVVDGPALRWLAEQTGPRLWISDGYVTGRHDATGPHLRTEAESICKQYRICRVNDAAEAIEMLKKLRRSLDAQRVHTKRRGAAR